MVTVQNSPAREHTQHSKQQIKSKRSPNSQDKSASTPKACKATGTKKHQATPQSGNAKKRNHQSQIHQSQSSPALANGTALQQTPKNNSRNSGSNSSRVHNVKQTPSKQHPNITSQFSTPPRPQQSTPSQGVVRARQAATPSPKSFAAAKCFKPPTADRLPAPPTSWTGRDGPASPSAFQGKNLFAAFAESVTASKAESNTGAFDLDAGQHLKLLLNVQA